MAKFSQRELMDDHKRARQSAFSKSQGDPSEQQVEFVNESPEQFGIDEHPFTGNRNNQRVAERIASEKGATAPVVQINTPQAAAKSDLDKAYDYEQSNPDEFVDIPEDDEDKDETTGRSKASSILPLLPSVGDANSSAYRGGAASAAATVLGTTAQTAATVAAVSGAQATGNGVAPPPPPPPPPAQS